MSDDFLPPWLKYKELKFGSMGWRMGYGEEYWTKFSKWFSSLNLNDVKIYIKKFPEPPEWSGFYRNKLKHQFPNEDIEQFFL